MEKNALPKSEKGLPFTKVVLWFALSTHINMVTGFVLTLGPIYVEFACSPFDCLPAFSTGTQVSSHSPKTYMLGHLTLTLICDFCKIYFDSRCVWVQKVLCLWVFLLEMGHFKCQCYSLYPKTAEMSSSTLLPCNFQCRRNGNRR